MRSVRLHDDLPTDHHLDNLCFAQIQTAPDAPVEEANPEINTPVSTKTLIFGIGFCKVALPLAFEIFEQIF